MLQIILGITRYNSVQFGFTVFQNRLRWSCTELYQVITRYNSVLLGFKTELNRFVLSCTELYQGIPSCTELYQKRCWSITTDIIGQFHLQREYIHTFGQGDKAFLTQKNWLSKQKITICKNLLSNFEKSVILNLSFLSVHEAPIIVGIFQQKQEKQFSNQNVLLLTNCARVLQGIFSYMWWIDC